jgi:uncharacterized FlaG/YvyC family protein
MVEGLQPTAGLSAVEPPARRFPPPPPRPEKVKDPADRAIEPPQQVPETLQGQQNVFQLPRTLEPQKDVQQDPAALEGQQNERLGDTSEGLDFALDFQFTGVRFRPIDNPPVIQARIFDRETREIIREVPTADELRFARAFRENLAERIGRYVDARA